MCVFFSTSAAHFMARCVFFFASEVFELSSFIWIILFLILERDDDNTQYNSSDTFHYTQLILISRMKLFRLCHQNEITFKENKYRVISILFVCLIFTYDRTYKHMLPPLLLHTQKSKRFRNAFLWRRLSKLIMTSLTL